MVKINIVYLILFIGYLVYIVRSLFNYRQGQSNRSEAILLINKDKQPSYIEKFMKLLGIPMVCILTVFMLLQPLIMGLNDSILQFHGPFMLISLIYSSYEKKQEFTMVETGLWIGFRFIPFDKIQKYQWHDGLRKKNETILTVSKNRLSTGMTTIPFEYKEQVDSLMKEHLKITEL